MKSTILKAGFAIIAGTFIVSFYSCGGNKTSSESTPSSTENVVVNESSTDGKTPVNSELYTKGEEIYKQTCQACHQANGEGIPNAFPPLAKSDYLLANKTRAIEQVIKGSSGEITVNGQKFNASMPPQDLTDDQIAEVLNYVLHSWGNNGEIVKADEVKAQRGI